MTIFDMEMSGYLYSRGTVEVVIHRALLRIRSLTRDRKAQCKVWLGVRVLVNARLTSELGK